LPQRNAYDTFSHTGEKRCTKITSKKSEPSGDINYIQRNGTYNRNQEKGGESGTPHTMFSSERRWNFSSTQKDYENKSESIQRSNNQQQLTKRRNLHGVQLVLHGKPLLWHIGHIF
jgi:hypothetical protein